MNLKKQKAFIVHIVYIIVIFGLVYIGIKYLLPLLMPFVIGLVIAMVFRRPIDFICSKLPVKRSFVSIIILILFYGFLGFIISMIGFKVFNFIKDLFYSLPDLYKKSIEPAISSISEDLILHFPQIEVYLQDFLSNINQSIFGFITNASTSVLGRITNFAGQLPSLLIKMIFTIVSSFFFTIDYYRIADFIIRQFNSDRREMIIKLKDDGIGTIGKFIRAYAAIISITFLELSFGFLILGIDNSFLLGALIALIDILPILGTGAVLLPWAVISFILGNTKVGIGIFILYIIITAVRQTIEPKIVGSQIGLHPILTLLLMYIGAQLMGVLGLLLLPIIATIIKTLNDEGTIHLFK